MNNKHDVVVDSVKWLKTSPFKATAVKVELEAEFGRENEDWDESDCRRFLMERLETIDLARKNSYGDYESTGALKYAMFYDDGSVDSEFTFTLSLEDPESVFLLPKIIGFWNELGEEIGGEFDTEGAGMHIALLNHRDCFYDNDDDSSGTSANQRRFRNFQRSMQLLIPALFFLASPDEVSRPLEFRAPKIESGYSAHGYDKFNAIWYAHQALEFRVFETCYRNPEAILDNLVVIRNCMKYWRLGYLPSGLSKIAPAVTFGNDDDYTIKRFYKTVQHIDLLDAGLAQLKPSYYTVAEVKQQRRFQLTKTEIRNAVRQRRIDARAEYDEYEERFKWKLAVDKHSYTAYNMSDARMRGISIEQAEAEAAQAAEAAIARDEQNKTQVQKFVADKLEQFQYSLRGSHTLEERS